MIIIDAKGLILGRLATYAAKQALLGEEVAIVNCEGAVVSGRKDTVIGRFRQRIKRGTHKKGPFIPRSPEFFVKRTIRGMLPYKQKKGREAYERIKCYRGVPEELKGKETVRVENAESSKLTIDYGSVGTICKELGGKI